jgi:lipid-A-disaccharide synthase
MTKISSNKKLMIIAGEVSGDIHGAHLMAALKSETPLLEFIGIGGDLMIREGLDASFHIRQMAFLGIVEVAKHLPFIRNVFKKMYALAASAKPDAIILIDYPGFNLRFAKRIDKMDIPVIYYISPQLWAWGKKRVYKIKKYIDKMLVIFPFEKEFYAHFNIPADYVGHPLADNFYNQVRPKKMVPGKKVLGLLPGSRHQELELLLPDMIKTAKILISQKTIQKALILQVNTINESYYKSLIGEESGIELYNKNVSDFYNQIDAALVSSGTASLESAYFQVPLVIVYRVSRLTWILGKMFVKLDIIGLPNIVAGKKIARELLQNDFVPENAGNLLTQLLEPETNTKRREELMIIRDKLGLPGASKRAAKGIIAFISRFPEA